MFSEVFDALEANNENTGGSYIEKRFNTYFIRGEGLVKSISDIEKIVGKDGEWSADPDSRCGQRGFWFGAPIWCYYVQRTRRSSRRASTNAQRRKIRMMWSTR